MASQPSNYLAQPAQGLGFTSQHGVNDVVRFFRRRWLYILGTAAIVSLIAALAILQAPRRYTAFATVAVQSQKKQLVDVANVMGDLPPDDATMATQSAIISSSGLTGQLVDQMHLDQDSEFNPAVGRAKRSFSIFNPSTWFGTDETKVSPRLTPRQVAEKRAAIIQSVSRAITVSPTPKSFVISISVVSQNPVKATTMANTLADLYIRDGIEEKFEASRRASSYLQSRVAELRGEALKTDQAAEFYRSSNGLTGNAQGATVDSQQLAELNSQLILARTDRVAKEAQLAQMRALTSNQGGEIEASGIVLQSPLIQRLRESESEVLRKLAELQANYGQNHPKMINANAELRDLRGKISDEVRKLAASTANDLSIARARENTLAGSLAGIEGRVNRGGAAEVRLRELQREADANKSVYETFLNRLKETNQQVDVQTADSRIISSATIPLSPSSPRIFMTISVAVIAGLLLGILLSLLLDKLDNTIRSADELEAIGGNATLAFLPVVANEYERPEDIVVERPQAMVTESLRTLRSALALSDVDNPPKVVMLSSSVPAEGKTFVSVGLARVSAQSGARTILIDADMRHPRVHSALCLENQTGLIQILGSEVSLRDAIQTDQATGLAVITAGTGIVNPPDLLRSDHMKRLIQELRSHYDFIVFDSPPFVPMTDSQILSAMVDKMLLVVRWGHTPVPVVQNAIKQLLRVGAPLVGSVMSRVHFSRQANYGYGDTSYHYSRYSAYYGASD